MPLTPNNREEHWLQGMVDGETTLEPNKRREYWYKEIVDAIGSGGGGGGGGVLVVGLNPQTMTLDKTWQEIHDAPCAVIKMPTNTGTKTLYLRTVDLGSDDAYILDFIMFNDTEHSIVPFVAFSADGYPVYDGE